MPRVAAGITGLVLIVVLVVGLLHSQQRLAGTNSVRTPDPVVTLGKQPVCQSGEIVPEGAAFVQVELQPGPPMPPLLAEVRSEAGRVLARGRAAAGARGGALTIAIPVVRRSVGGAQVCLRTAGRGARVDVRGQANATGHITVGGEKRPGVMRIGYLRAGSESWLELAPTIAHRFAQAKTRVATPFTFWLLLLAVLGVAGLAVRAAVSDDEEIA